jgi:arginine deiminase
LRHFAKEKVNLTPSNIEELRQHHSKIKWNDDILIKMLVVSPGRVAQKAFGRGLCKVASHVQVSEFDNPTDIITHCPSIETRFPFHMAACLFEHPPDPDKAVKCHDDFRKVMASVTGDRVWTVREVLQSFSIGELQDVLMNFSSVHFNLYLGKHMPDPHKEQMLTREYIRESLSRLEKDDLIDLIFLRPRLVIDVDGSSSGFKYDKIPLSPLANLTFTRDQQITTAKGVVIGKFGAIQRIPENDLMKVVWKQLSVNPVGAIKGPGTLEGGDFMSFNRNLALCGVGLRTNMAAMHQLMELDVLGTNRFVVVKDEVDCDQQRMHLDTFFNMCSEKLCVCLEAIANDEPKYVRHAVEYVKNDKGKYEVVGTMPFGQWLKKEGFTVVPASFQQQEGYFLNLLHLGKNKKGKAQVLVINPDVEKAIKERGFDGDVHYIDFQAITAMYGGAHCATQVLRQPGH